MPQIEHPAALWTGEIVIGKSPWFQKSSVISVLQPNSNSFTNICSVSNLISWILEWPISKNLQLPPHITIWANSISITYTTYNVVNSLPKPHSKNESYIFKKLSNLWFYHKNSLYLGNIILNSMWFCEIHYPWFWKSLYWMYLDYFSRLWLFAELYYIIFYINESPKNQYYFNYYHIHIHI